MRGKALSAGLLSLVAVQARAGIVYNQPAGTSGTVMPSSRMDPDGSDWDQFVWDDFTLSADAAISEIQWRGGFRPDYFGSGGPVIDFAVSIYANSIANEPDIIHAPLVRYHTNDNASQTPAGSVGGTAMYSYSFILPAAFNAAAGTKYWLQIEASHRGIPDWGLQPGTSSGSYGYFRRISGQGDAYYQRMSGDAAFTLLDGTVPDPTIVWSGGVAPDTRWTEAGNWTGVKVPASGALVKFADNSKNSYAVNVDAPVTLSALTIDTSAHAYLLSGNAISFVAAGALSVLNSPPAGHTISASVSAASGDLTIDLQNASWLALDGGLTIGSGRTTSVTGDGCLIMTHVNGGNLIADGTTISLTDALAGEIDQLTLNGFAALELAGPATQLLVRNGVLADLENAAAGGWIYGSDLGPEGMYKTVAILDRGPAGVLLLHTWQGDLDGDGAITGADYVRMDQSFLNVPAFLAYRDGDINRDGMLTGDDYFLVDSAFFAQTSAVLATPAVPVSVPEPGALAAGCSLAMMLIRRRRV